ncbi:uncharacterized protein [Palaemon carinicauda]|uniref:uncharacterized protein n=1 Tax=Palaemon carinicauda TaxID=392227 RepID=UPI0035B6A0C2
MAVGSGEWAAFPNPPSPLRSSPSCSSSSPSLSSSSSSSPSSQSSSSSSSWSSPQSNGGRVAGRPVATSRLLLLPWLTLMFIIWTTCLREVESRKCIMLSDRNLTDPPAKYVYDKTLQRQLALTLDSSQRISHRISTAVVKILLEEGLGYQDVTINNYVEDTFDYEKALDRLRVVLMNGNGTYSNVPTAMINVEVWLPPSSMGEDIAAKVDCGSHASGSRFGWYVTNSSRTGPKELITDHWRSFKSLNVTKIFSLDSHEINELRQKYTRDKDGQYYCHAAYCEEGIFTPEACQGVSECAILFVGNHSSYSEFLIKQVTVEKMYVRIAWIGPNFTPEFFCQFRNNKPSVFFDWYPNSLSNMKEYMPVSFPPCNSYQGTDDSYFCNYELHSMKKLIWDKLPESAKVAVEAVKRFFLREEDYRNLLHRYNEKTSQCPYQSSNAVVDINKVIEDVACDWLREARHNELEVWNDWLPHNYAAKTKLWIAGIFPMSSGADTTFYSHTLYNAAQMAITRVNSNGTILPEYEIKLMIQDGRCKSEEVLAAFIRYVRKGSSDPNLPSFEQMIGVLGPACSDTVEPLAGVAKHFNTVVLSYSAEGAIFNEHEKYPSFFRTIPENKMYGAVYLELFKLFGWHQVASLAEDCNKYSEYLTLLHNMLPKDINLENFRFPKISTRNMTDHLLKLKEKTHRIIIGDFYATTAKEVLCEAYHQNMTAKHNYVWFLPRWFAPNWYEIDEYDKIPCNRTMMLEAVDRHMSLGYAYYAPMNYTFHEGITVGDWYELYAKEFGINSDTHGPADYAGYTYDAVWTYAFALDKLLKENRTHVANLHSLKTNKRFVELIGETDFDGVSGNIKFNSGPSRQSVINIMQYVVSGNSGSYVTVGQFFPAGNGSTSGRLSLVREETKFFNGVPSDGIIPDTCLFQTFSEILDVSCDMAIVIVMVMIFSVFAIIVLALFIVYKRRFEKMIPEQPVWPLGELMSLDEWELPREKVVINRTIGEGAFGTVYGGECQFGEDTPWVAVAVKTLKVGSTVEEKLDFLGEAEMMKRFNHKNIVQLLGLCTHQEPIYMVMEFMLYGDLKIYLLARRHLVSDKTVQTEEDEVSSKRLTSMALDICRALAYLTEHRYVHRDVACRNCLVSAERVVKLSDFGMTRPMYESEYYRFNRKAMMPVRWMSPEALEDGLFTSMSDMWSYGVLLYEVITFGSFPFQGMSNNEVVEHVRRGNTVTLPDGVKPQLERLLRSCWCKIPSERPTFNEMMEHLTMWPRLITPCLEVPSAAVQMNDTDSLELVILPTEPTLRRASAPNTRLPTTRIRNPSGNDTLPNCSALQMNNLSQPTSFLTNSFGPSTPSSLNPPTSFNSPSWNRAIHENGEGPSVEPLLPQNGDGYISSYVRLQNPKSGEDTIRNFDFPSNMTAV